MSSDRRWWFAVLLMLLTGPVLATDGVTFKPSAKLHLDSVSHRDDVRDLKDNGMVRRAGVGLKGKFGDHWALELGYDFAGEGATKDVALTYSGWEAADLHIGQFKVPFGMEELSSSNATVFVERAAVGDAFAVSRRIGVGLERARSHTYIAAMGFGSNIDGDTHGRGVALRAAVSPIQTESQVLHLGLAVATERPHGAMKVSARPESKASDIKFVNTGRLDSIARADRIGLEVAWQRGPLLLQSEWMQMRLPRDLGMTTARLDGGYVMASWILTGQSRGYRKGVFKGIDGPAWELGLRYGWVDLDDADVLGGRQQTLGVGLNYYANSHLRIMANYTQVHSTRRGVQDDPAILLLRLQLTY